MVPSVNDPRWRGVVTGATAFQPRMLAAQILMGRLRLSVQRDQSSSITRSAATTDAGSSRGSTAAIAHPARGETRRPRPRRRPAA